MSELGQAALAAAARRAAESPRADLRARGVVPTPLPVAEHALRHVDTLLRTELGIARGLASERVVVIDPAVGTGVWLAALLDLTRTRGAASSLFGFDTDALAVAEVEALLAPAASAQGAALTLRATNTLELAEPFPPDDRVRVIVGNPPWAARSLSRGGALSDAWLAEFRHDQRGQSLGERRSGVLSDDYVRFFRWSLEHARTARGGAVVCLATNASYLDGPVHRGMRAALCAAFDRIDVLDLGGNALLSRALGRDDNVFGVRVGAAVTCALRRPESERVETRPRTRAQSVETGPARLTFFALRGSVADKLAALASPTEFAREQHHPEPPWFLFRPGRGASQEPGFSLAEAFPFHREGVQTNRDALATAHTREELAERVWAIERGTLALTALRHFDPGKVRRVLADARARGDDCLHRLAYRPFDDRWFVALAPLCHRPRPDLLMAAAHASISLLAVRKDRGAAPFNLFASARTSADACFLSTRSSCRTRVFPSRAPDGTDNVSPAIAEALGHRLGRVVTGSELVAYALSVLGSPRYRERHQEALRLDYAQLPWPRDAGHFERAVAVGLRFDAALHERAPRPSGWTWELAAGALLTDPLGSAPVGYDRARARVVQDGRVLLSGVMPASWDAQVGHHGLLRSALCAERGVPPTLATLCEAVARAALWASTEAEADALLAR
ncbi:MAG: hypothetical protein RLZZ450_1067 [Pseudomonadota bacterium]